MYSLSYAAQAPARRLLRVLLLRLGGLPAHPGERLLPLKESMVEPIAFEMSELQSAAQLIYRVMPPTPLYAWPKLKRRLGVSVHVKHENHTPTGAFKVRGGIVYLDRLCRAQPYIRGVISATRGNHGQSIAFAAGRAGVPATIYVPIGNSPDQNSAISGLRRAAGRIWRGFRRSEARSLQDGRRGGPALHSLLSSRPHRRRRELCAGALHRGSRPGRAVRGHGHGIRTLRSDSGARSSRPQD